MRRFFTPNVLHYFFAAVWIVNGLLCKIMNLEPRHQEIVARILGHDHVRLFTVLIGLAEIGMAIWILSGHLKRLNVIVQIAVIAIMNVLEFFIAPDLLLWGKFNSIFAFLLITMIFLNEFRLFKKKQITC